MMRRSECGFGLQRCSKSGRTPIVTSSSSLRVCITASQYIEGIGCARDRICCSYIRKILGILQLNVNMLRQLFVDEFATSLIPTDLAAVLPDLEGKQFVATRSSTNGNCLFNSISMLMKGWNLSFL